MTRIQLDTNVLTRLAQSSHPLHGTALTAVQELQSAGHVLCIVPQNLFEFWVVATRPPADNGLGLEVPEAKAELWPVRKKMQHCHLNRSATQQRKNRPRSSFGRLAIDCSFRRVSSFSSAFVLAWWLANSRCFR